jgi:hypothetical protein
MNEYMMSVLANIRGYKKIYSSSNDGFNEKNFHEKCKNHIHTIAISKSNHAKILGGYSPIKWTNFDHTAVTVG